MQITGPALSATLLVYGLGLASMSLWGTIEGQPHDLCSGDICNDLDICQNLAENLNTALSPRYNSAAKGIRCIYDRKKKPLTSLTLYNMTSICLNEFKGLSSALDNYMTSSKYRVESRNLNEFALTVLLKNNLSSLIDFTDRAVDDMAFTLNRTDESFEFSPVDIEPEKSTIYPHVFEASQMFKGMIKSWRQKCSKCSKRSKTQKVRTCGRNCVCPTNAKGGKNRSEKAKKKPAGQ